MPEQRPTVMTEPGVFRYRNRLPRSAEGKQPSADLRATVTEAADGTGATVGRLYIFDYIDSWGGYWGISAGEVAAALDEIGNVDEIHLHINSGGGEVYEAIAIKNLLAAHPAKVIAFVDGIAASAASFIAVGADETVMAENSELMIHDARTYAAGDAAAMRQVAVDLDRVSENIASIYASHAGEGSTETWRSAMRATTWYSADEAVEAGLADRVGLDADEAEGTEVITPDEPEPAPVEPVDNRRQGSAIAARHRLNASRAKGIAPSA